MARKKTPLEMLRWMREHRFSYKQINEAIAATGHDAIDAGNMSRMLNNGYNITDAQAVKLQDAYRYLRQSS